MLCRSTVISLIKQENVERCRESQMCKDELLVKPKRRGVQSLVLLFLPSAQRVPPENARVAKVSHLMLAHRSRNHCVACIYEILGDASFFKLDIHHQSLACRHIRT